MKPIGYIYEESDYSKFKYLGGNRDINHAKELMESIIANGYYNVPILVNENMEIIDGQGRFEALKMLSLPIHYVMEEGANLKACRVLNMKQTNWNIADYVKSYVEGCDDNYLRLNRLAERYKGVFTLTQVAKFGAGECIPGGGSSSVYKKIKNGTYKLGEVKYLNLVDMLDYLKQFKGSIKNSKAQGRSYYLYEVLRFCYESPVIDNDKMLDRFEAYAHSFLKGIATLDDALNQVDQIYNVNSRKKTNILTLYKAAKMR